MSPKRKKVTLTFELAKGKLKVGLKSGTMLFQKAGREGWALIEPKDDVQVTFGPPFQQFYHGQKVVLAVLVWSHVTECFELHRSCPS